jgi:hypothetical protein
MNDQSFPYRIILPTLATLVIVLGGCGGENNGPAIYPVTGKVLVDGQPASKAQVTFHRSGGPADHPTPIAEADADGNFSPSTHLTKDGAPAGDYTLTVVWPEFKVDHGEEIAGPDRLRGLYANPGTSTLKITIKEGENALPPFELKSTGPSSTGSSERGR